MKILKALSIIFYPTIIAIPLVIAVAWPSVLNVGIGLFFISIIPMIFVVIYSKTHHTDWDVTDQSKRNWPFIAAMIFQLIAIGIFWCTGSKTMLALSAAYFAVTFSLFLINFKTKISVHCAGVAGAVTDVVYVFGWQWSFLFLLVPLVAYIRIKAKAHTLAQTIYGSIMSAALSFLVFYLILH